VPRKKTGTTPASPGRQRVMNGYRELKKKIAQRVAILSEVIQEMESREVAETVACERWKDHLNQVSFSLEDPLLRIAVVGTVKSGKSTLINALLGKDLLKRGAGIITAFITRLITSAETEGWVEFKPWPQILDELNATLGIIPHYYDLVDENHRFDVRNAEDRDRLKVLLAGVQDEWRLKDGRLDPSHMLLRGYLDGYERVQQFMGEETNRLSFDEQSLGRHQLYVGSEGQAVYLRDMELHYPVAWLGEGIELADCQGIDSPNPLHFALLQQYLLRSHFILYVISSRSGLREADFRLLDFIRTLKMLPQTFFVLNADLDDHPNREDLEQLAERVRSELSWAVGTPRFFLFSGLYHLIAQLKGSASERERRHLRLWRGEAPLAHLSDAGFSEFRERLSHEICGKRYRVLCGSGLSRLSMIAAGVMNTAAVQRELLAQGVEGARQAAAGLKDREERLLGSLETLKNAIAGLRVSLREETDHTLGAYFDFERGRVIKETLEAVEDHPLYSRDETIPGDYRWLFHQFHHLYRDFRQSLARYLVEKVNLQVIAFAKKQETSLCERLRRAAEAFWVLFEAALEDYRRETGLFDTTRRSSVARPKTCFQIRGVIAPPNFSAFVDDGAIGRGMLLMKLGLSSFTRLLGDFRVRLGKPKDLLLGEKRYQTLIEEAIKLLKKEAGRELIQAFREYEKRLKSDYLYRIVDEESKRLLQEFQIRTDMVRVELGDLLERGESEGSERQSLLDTLTWAHQISQAMLEELEELRNTLE
jgi:GTPase SAR1 family protein